MRSFVIILIILTHLSQGTTQAFSEVEFLMRIGFFENTNASVVEGSFKDDIAYTFDTEENLSSSLLEFGAKINFLENHRFVVSLATFKNGQILSGFFRDTSGMITEARPLVTNYKYLNFRVGHEVIIPIAKRWSFYFQNALLLQHNTNGSSVKAVDIENLNYSYAGEFGVEIIINEWFNFNAGFTMFRYLQSFEADNVVGEFKPISYGLVLGFGYKMSSNYR